MRFGSIYLAVSATRSQFTFTDGTPRPRATTRPSFDRVLDDRLAVMDATAIVLCRDNGIPLRVFNLNNVGDLQRVVRGENVGTLVTND